MVNKYIFFRIRLFAYLSCHLMITKLWIYYYDGWRFKFYSLSFNTHYFLLLSRVKAFAQIVQIIMDFILTNKYDDFIAFNSPSDPPPPKKWHSSTMNHATNLTWKLLKWSTLLNKVWSLLDIYKWLVCCCMHICIFDLKVYWNFELIF